MTEFSARSRPVIALEDGQRFGRVRPGDDRVLLRRSAIAVIRRPPILDGEPPPPPPPPPVRGLPRVDDDAAAAFPDQNVPGAWWYVPEFQMVSPDAASTPDATPFLFSFRTSGHDAENRPGIDATVTVAVRSVFSEQARAVVGSADGAALPVPLTGLALTLLVPYRDASGQPTVLPVPATTVDAGPDLTTAMFEVKDAFARAAYGVLSTPDYQEQPARLQVDYTFAAVRQVSTGPWWWPLHLPVVDTVNPRPFVTATTRARFLPDAAVMAAQPVAQPVLAQAATQPFVAQPFVAQSVVAPATFVSESGTPSLTALQVRDHRGSSRFDGELIRTSWPGTGGDMTFATVTVSRQAVLDVFVPCATRGGLYVEQADSGRQAVGCQDSLGLGTLPDRMYAELPEFATDRWRLFWSLSRPGTYLLLPLRYRVSRDDGQVDAAGLLQPLIGWLQEFDATRDDQLPCLLTATLAPDLTPDDVAAVVDALAQRTAAPQILLPTSPASGLASIAATWTLGTDERPVTVLDGDLVRVGVRASYADAAIIHQQLVADAQPLLGNATFTLSDGSTLGPVALHLSVDDLAGPWPTGPVAVALDAGSVTLTDRAGGAATVKALRCTTAAGVTTVSDGLPVVVPPGGTATAAVPDGTVAVVPHYELGPAAPATVHAARIYLDDLHTVAVVINDVQMSGAGITGVDVSVRLGSDPATVSFSMTPDLPQYELDIVEPLVADRQADAAVIHLTGTARLATGDTRPATEVAVDLHDGAVIRLSLLVPQG